MLARLRIPAPCSPWSPGALFARASTLALACLGALLASSCEDNGPAGPVEPIPPTTQIAWVGQFTSGSDQGPIVFDLFQTGTTVTGETVFSSPGLASIAPAHLSLWGTLQDGTLQLVRPGPVPPEVTFTVDASIDPQGNLAGSMALSYPPLQADLVCRPLPRGKTTIELAVNVPMVVKAMVFDGVHLWLSTTGDDDYVRMQTDGSLVDSVPVLLSGGAHWTSDALTYDGDMLWGHLPLTIQDPSGTHNASRIIGFDSHGQVARTFQIEHRTHGLAFDVSRYWSLDGESLRLDAFDGSGTVQASFKIDVPDPSHLEFDGAHYWTLGWAMRRLYALDADGRAVRIYDLPGRGFRFHSGIAVEGTHLWYGHANPLQSPSTTALYRLRLD